MSLSYSGKEEGSAGLILVASAAALSLIVILTNIFLPSDSTRQRAARASTTTTLTPIADTYFKKDNQTNSYGTDTKLSCQGDDLRITYLKFDLAELANTRIISAHLTISLLTDGGSNATQLFQYVPNSNWSEDSTYDSIFNGTDISLRPASTIATIQGGKAGEVIRIPVLTSIQQNTGKQITFACVPSSMTDSNADDDLKFHSRESLSGKPILVIQHEPLETVTPTQTPTNTLTPTMTASPTPTCTARPPCLDSQPACTLPEPAGGWCRPSVSCLSIAPPLPPINLSPDGRIAAGSRQFSWVPQQAATSFALRIDDLSDPFNYSYSGGECKAESANDICIDNLNTTSYTVTLKPAHTYRWWVHAKNACDAWSQAGSAQVYAVTDTVVTPAPTCTPQPVCDPRYPCITLQSPPGGYCDIISPLNVETPHTTAKAADFYIITNGQKYTPKQSGFQTYETIINNTNIQLNISWAEPNGLMKLRLSFALNNNQWAVTEARTSLMPGSPDWVIYPNLNIGATNHTAYSSQVLRISNHQEDPTQPHIYFRNIDLLATFPNQPTPTSQITSSPRCQKKPYGDANCDSKIDLVDFELWREQFAKGGAPAAVNSADFNNSLKVDLVDFETWRQGFVAKFLP